MAAPTIVRTPNFYEITVITEDLTPEDIFQDSNAHKLRKIKRIEFVGGAIDDKCVIKMNDENGATICTLATAVVVVPDTVRFKGGGQYMDPFIDFSDGTFTAQGAHKLIIEVA